MKILQQASEYSQASLKWPGTPELRLRVVSISQSRLLAVTQGTRHSSHRSNLDGGNDYSQGRSGSNRHRRTIEVGSFFSKECQNNLFKTHSQQSAEPRHIWMSVSLRRLRFHTSSLVICLCCTILDIVAVCVFSRIKEDAAVTRSGRLLLLLRL